jgi:hypothetical protein
MKSCGLRYPDIYDIGIFENIHAYSVQPPLYLPLDRGKKHGYILWIVAATFLYD